MDPSEQTMTVRALPAEAETEHDIALLEQWYAQIESRFDVEVPESGWLRFLCDGRLNENIPIHSWYTLKEAFSARFPVWLVEYLADIYDFHPERVLDPFVGGGTTNISLSLTGIHTLGVEYNPFIAWMAHVKSCWWAYDPDEIKHTIEKLAFDVPTGMRLRWPKLTTFHRTKYFRRSDVRVLLYVLAQIEDSDGSNLTKQFLRLGVAAAVEEISNLRKDGRALRYVRKKRRPTAQTALINNWHRSLKGLEESLSGLEDAQPDDSCICEGSALDLTDLRKPWEGTSSLSISDSAFDLVLYSPPYLNNFDYSEIYKLELWLLGFVKTYGQWKELRHSTLRSHHSVKFEVTSHLNDNPTAAEVAGYLTAMGSSTLLTGYASETMPPVILGYFDDMYLALKEQFRVLKPGGFLTYMVANSRHSDLPIATDLIIGEIAGLVGFIPLKLIVLHKRNGRTRRKKYLRESVVILRKPQ